MNGGPPLGALIDQAANSFASRTCLIHGDTRWTFAEFANDAHAIAHHLASRLPHGARVALFMPNRPEYVLLQLALEIAGLVRVPINARFTEHEVGVLIADCDASAMFFDHATMDRASAVASRSPNLWCCEVDGCVACNGPAWNALLDVSDCGSSQRAVAIDDLCSINYTSGTTGSPKGVMLTHRNWIAMYRNMLVDRDFRGDDIVAHIGPLSHASGTYFTAFFLRGACNVLPDEATVDALLSAIDRHRATLFTCVPTVLTRIVNHPRLDSLDLSSLRAIGYGAEPIPFNTLERALERFGPILTQNYGQTEAMMTITLLRPDEHFAGSNGERQLRVGCIGRPYTFVEVVLRGTDGRVVPDGEIGEITVRSEHVMKGYWNRPAETADAVRDGWLWTGDLACRDAEGFVTLAGRRKEMLISGGFNIYPHEVEAALTSHPDVLEAAVVGVPDANWGEIAAAFVAVAPGAARDGDALRTFCKKTLGFKSPRVFHFIDALPKTANGKIDKSSLRTHAVAAHEATHG